MRNKKLILFVCFLVQGFLLNAQEQQVDSVLFDHHFPFQDGIYFTFSEFAANKPAVADFQIRKKGIISGDELVELVYNDTAGQERIVNICWGYCRNGKIHIYQGLSGNFFRMQIIGRLCHFLAFSSSNGPVYHTGNYVHMSASRELRAFFLDMDTGEKIYFTYKNFRAFLEIYDIELYNELESSKKKRKRIFQFLLKYNEKNPLYLRP